MWNAGPVHLSLASNYGHSTEKNTLLYFLFPAPLPFSPTSNDAAALGTVRTLIMTSTLTVLHEVDETTAVVNLEAPPNDQFAQVSPPPLL